MPEKMIEYDHSYDIRLEEPLSCQSFDFLIRTPPIFPVSTGSTASPSNEHCDFKIIIIINYHHWSNNDGNNNIEYLFQAIPWFRWIDT